ncbi:hypothetical protein ABEW06_07950 [Peribacillus simplex]
MTEKVRRPEAVATDKLTKHRPLQATFLGKKSHQLYPIHAHEQKKDSFAAMNVKKMANWTSQGPRIA